MHTASHTPLNDHPEANDLAELRLLFHRLNNELGIILSHAELLETKAPDATSKSRAGQVVTSVLDALTTAREIRRRMADQPT